MNAIVTLNAPKKTGQPAIFVFPHAGGSPRFFHFWGERLAAFPLFGITYQGRDHLLQMPQPPSLRALAATVAAELQHHPMVISGVPLFLVGHSMGAWLAYETAILLERQIDNRVVTVVSGQNPPTLLPRSTLHQAEDAVLIADINRQNPAGSELWQIPELRALFLPIIRMDYRLLETYQPSGGKVRELAVIYGRQDTEIWTQYLYQWQDFTHYQHPLTCVDGNHFYIARPNTALPDLLYQLACSSSVQKEKPCLS